MLSGKTLQAILAEIEWGDADQEELIYEDLYAVLKTYELELVRSEDNKLDALSFRGWVKGTVFIEGPSPLIKMGKTFEKALLEYVSKHDVTSIKWQVSRKTKVDANCM